MTSESNRATEATAITPGDVYRQAREQATQQGDYDVQGGVDRFSAWLREESADSGDLASHSISSDEPVPTGAGSAHQGQRDTDRIIRQSPASSIRRLRRKAHRSQRQAQLTLARLEPWSVMKFSFIASTAAAVVLFAAVAVLYPVLSSFGVLTALQDTVTTLTTSKAHAGIDASSWFSASKILGCTGMLSALSIVLITTGSTISAVIYNRIARAIGGIEVTLRETD